MRINRAIAVLLLSLVGISASAQEPTPTSDYSEVTDGCTEELSKSAFETFERRKFRGTEGLGAARHQLLSVAWFCQERPAGNRAKEMLRVVEEEVDDHNLVIGRYYVLKARNGKSKGNGAVYRLEEILTRSPNFSKLDEALSLLVQAHSVIGDSEKARKYYQRLLMEYPTSQHINAATIELNSFHPVKAP